jgi:uncharacterized membrane protein YeaQ/YmgE (transglycosylase-associated protein family)
MIAVVVIGLVGVAAGALSRRSRRPGLVLIVVLGVVATVAVLTRPTAGALDVLAPLVALIVSVGTFVVLPGWVGAADSPRGTMRWRGCLAARCSSGSVAIAAGAGIAATGGRLLTGRGGVEASRKAVGRIVPTVAAPPIPPGADFAADGSPSFITPNRDFYRVDVNLTLPQLRAEDWRLRVHGMVNRELILNWADLKSRKLIERPVTMTCVSNEVGGPTSLPPISLACCWLTSSGRPGCGGVRTRCHHQRRRVDLWQSDHRPDRPRQAGKPCW